MYTNDPNLLKLVGKYAPDKKFATKKTVEVKQSLAVTPTSLRWGGGYKNDYVVVCLVSGDCVSIPEPDFRESSSMSPMKMRAGIAVIQYTWSGNAKYVTVHLHPDNITPMIEHKAGLSKEEEVFLFCTRCYKNSYGGETNIRKKEANRIMAANYEEVKASLISKGFLNKAGSLTLSGKNAASSLSF